MVHVFSKDGNARDRETINLVHQTNKLLILIFLRMKKNMGTIDKVVRILIAFVVIGLYFANVISGIVAIVLLILSAVFILTSLLSFCPLYLPFGINTGKKKE